MGTTIGSCIEDEEKQQQGFPFATLRPQYGADGADAHVLLSQGRHQLQIWEANHNDVGNVSVDSDQVLEAYNRLKRDHQPTSDDADLDTEGQNDGPCVATYPQDVIAMRTNKHFLQDFRCIGRQPGIRSKSYNLECKITKKRYFCELLTAHDNGSTVVDNYRNLVKQLDHFTLPRVAQENIFDDSVYLITAVDDSCSSTPLHRWAKQHESLLKEVNTISNEVPVLMRLNSHHCKNLRSAKGFFEGDSTRAPETPQSQSVSTMASSTGTRSLHMSKVGSQTFSTASSLVVDEAEQMVKANLKELNPEALFKKKPFVSKDYKCQTARLLKQLSRSETIEQPQEALSVLELEQKMLSIVRQLLQAVSYLHCQKIAHRDIRLETVEVVASSELQPDDVRIQFKSLHKAVKLEAAEQRLFDDLDGLQFCAPEIFNKWTGHSLAVDEYAIGVLAFFLFSGMKDYPCKIPLSLTDDMEIYEYIRSSQVEFKQPVWAHYSKSRQIKDLISGLLAFDDSKRLRADTALSFDLFSPASRLSGQLESPVLRGLEDLLFINAFKSCSDVVGGAGPPINPVVKGVLYYVAHRVISEKSYSYYREVWRHVEGLCSQKLDGHIRKSDIERLPINLRSTMLVIFTQFAHFPSTDHTLTPKQPNQLDLIGHEIRPQRLYQTPAHTEDDSTDQNKVLSLLDFIAAIHDLSTMVSLEQPLAHAFYLMGGTDSDGLSLAELCKAIISSNGQKSVLQQRFFTSVKDLIQPVSASKQNRGASKASSCEDCLPIFAEPKKDAIDFSELSLQKSVSDIFSSSEYDDDDSCSGSDPSSLADNIYMPTAQTRIADLLSNRCVMNFTLNQNTDRSTPERKSRQLRSPRAKNRPVERDSTPSPEKFQSALDDLCFSESSLHSKMQALSSPSNRMRQIQNFIVPESGSGGSSQPCQSTSPGSGFLSSAAIMRLHRQGADEKEPVEDDCSKNPMQTQSTMASPDSNDKRFRLMAHSTYLLESGRQGGASSKAQRQKKLDFEGASPDSSEALVRTPFKNSAIRRYRNYHDSAFWREDMASNGLKQASTSRSPTKRDFSPSKSPFHANVSPVLETKRRRQHREYRSQRDYYQQLRLQQEEEEEEDWEQEERVQGELVCQVKITPQTRLSKQQFITIFSRKSKNIV